METKKVVRGMKVAGFASDIPGYWEVVSLRPFKVMGVQDGKRFPLYTVTKWDFLLELEGREEIDGVWR